MPWNDSLFTSPMITFYFYLLHPLHSTYTFYIHFYITQLYAKKSSQCIYNLSCRTILENFLDHAFPFFVRRGHKTLLWVQPPIKIVMQKSIYIYYFIYYFIYYCTKNVNKLISALFLLFQKVSVFLFAEARQFSRVFLQ